MTTVGYRTVGGGGGLGGRGQGEGLVPNCHSIGSPPPHPIAVTVSFVSPAYYYYTTNTTGYVVVQKTGTSAIPVVVTVTAPSSAQPNPSVGVISSTITFLPGGNAVQNIPFTITDHGIALRSVETHSVALSNPSQGVVLGQPNQTSVVIMDTNSKGITHTYMHICTKGSIPSPHPRGMLNLAIGTCRY